MIQALCCETLIDGRGSAPLRDAVVVIDGERIVAVGPRDDVRVPTGATVRQAPAGATVMPGLIDTHLHVAGWGIARNRLDVLPSQAILRTVQPLRATLDSGVTTARDGGGADAGIKRALAEGAIDGPRLQVAVAVLGPTGGMSDGTGVLGQALPSYPGLIDGRCDGPDACRAKVREVVRAGADAIKLATTGGVNSEAIPPHRRVFSQAEIDAIVEEAHFAGKPVMCHALGGSGVLAAIRAGVDSVEHGAYLDELPGAVEEMAERGIILVPTFMVYLHHGTLGTPLRRERARALTEHHRESVRRAVAAGVTIAMGTDVGNYSSGRNGTELTLMCEAGLSPMQAIMASTRDAARCLRIEDETGTLESGKLADLIVVDGDPLADIAILGDPDRVRLVVQGGRNVKDLGAG